MQHRELRPRRVQPVSEVADVAPLTGAGAGSASPLSRRSSSNIRGFATTRGQMAGREELGDEWPGSAWRAFAAASAGLIEYLVDVYLQVVYPM